jgi:hypothetical protein
MAATKRRLDFTNVREMDVDNHRVEEGWHPAKLTKVDDHEKDGSEGWRYIVELTRGKFKGHTYAIYCMLEDNQLWKVRNLATAAGLKVPKKVVNVDPEKLLNREFALYLSDDEYKDREQSKPTLPLCAPLEDIDADQWADGGVAKFFRGDGAEEPEAEAEEEPEDEAPPPKTKTKTKAAPKPAEPDEEEEVEEIDLDEI